MINYAGAIFDLDGTLLNTVEDIAFAMNKVLTQNNLPTHDVITYQSLVGRGLYNLVCQSVPSSVQEPGLLNIYLNQLVAEYTKCIDTKTKPYPGITDMLDGLTQKKIKLAILSNKAHSFMDNIAKTHFAKWKFVNIFGARDNVPSKPNPHSAIEIATHMGLPTNQIVYVGDTDVDMQTATSAKMYPVGAAWGFRTKEELLTNGALKIINHPMELLNIFNN